MKRLLTTCLTLSVLCFAPLSLANVAAEDQPMATPESALEAKYRAEFEKKVADQAERQKESLNSLFYGMAAIAVVLLALGVFTTLKTKKLQDELNRLKG